MTDSITFRASGRSPLTKFVDVLMQERDLLDRALERDALALKVLSGPGLGIAVNRNNRLRVLHKTGKWSRRDWTRRDQERLAWLKGLRDGGYPQGRVELLLRKHPAPRITQLFQSALGEARSEGTAKAVSPALSELRRAHNELRAMAYSLSQREPPGDDKSEDWGEVYSRQSVALNEVIPFCPAPNKRDTDKETDEDIDDVPECLVTFLQMGSMTHQSKRWVRRLYDAGLLPVPKVQGGNGKPHKFIWAEVRPILEKESGCKLPELYPADRFVRY